MLSKKTISTLCILVALLLPSISAPTLAKEYSIYARQKQLMKDINKAQKTNQLTDKEAKKLRKKLATVARKKRKMLKKADESKLSIDNKVVLEKELNDISVEIKKLMLEKRVDAMKAEDK